MPAAVASAREAVSAEATATIDDLRAQVSILYTSGVQGHPELPEDSSQAPNTAACSPEMIQSSRTS